MRGYGGGSNAVLACAGFRNDARLAHFYGEQALADGVINFVRAGVEQVLALEINAWPTEMRRETRSKLQRRGTTCEIFEQVGELRLKLCVGFCRFVGALKLEERDHQRFGNVASTVGTETSGSECGR